MVASVSSVSCIAIRRCHQLALRVCALCCLGCCSGAACGHALPSQCSFAILPSHSVQMWEAVKASASEQFAASRLAPSLSHACGLQPRSHVKSTAPLSLPADLLFGGRSELQARPAEPLSSVVVSSSARSCACPLHAGGTALQPCTLGCIFAPGCVPQL